MRSATARASASLPPQGGTRRTRVTGRVGKDCATAAVATHAQQRSNEQRSHAVRGCGHRATDQSTFRLSFLISAAPLALFAVDVRGVFVGRRGQRVAAFGLDALLDHIGVDQRAQLLVEAIDDRPRRAGRREQPVMQHGVETRQPGFVGGRHVRQQAEARRADHGDGAQRAGLQIAERRRQHAERDRDMIAEQVVHHLPGALVRDDGGLDAGDRLEQFSREIAAGADRRGADVELAAFCLGDRDHVGDGLGRERGMREQRDRHRGDQPDRREILARIEAGIGVEARIDRDRAGMAKE